MYPTPVQVQDYADRIARRKRCLVWAEANGVPLTHDREAIAQLEAIYATFLAQRGNSEMEDIVTEPDKLSVINTTASDERSAVAPSGGLINRTDNEERNAVPPSGGLINSSLPSRQD